MHDEAAVSYDKADLNELGAIEKAKPTVHDVARAYGSEVVEEVNEFGKREVVTRFNAGRASPNRGALRELMAPSWKMETERALKFSETQKHEVLVAPDGTQKRVLASMAETVAKLGNLKPKRHYGRASWKYVRGRWYKRVGSDWVDVEEMD